MQTVNETNEQSSETTSGLKSTVFNGLKALFRWNGSKSPVETYKVIYLAAYDIDEGDNIAGWYIVKNDNELYAGPYKRERDAKGQLTRLRKGYTPAARKV